MTEAPTGLDARQRVSQLIEGYRRSALVHTAAQLGIAAHLATGRRGAAELARLTDTHQGPLTQVLRALVGLGVLDQDEDDRFGLTEAGAFLDPAHPQSLHGPAIYFGGLSYQAYAGLTASLRDGGIAFDHVFGMPYYEYLDRDPVLAEHYHRMIALGHGTGALIASLFDFGAARSVVDVGGGNGSLLAEILTHAPHASGVLVELPLTEPSALETLGRVPGGDRCRFVPGDFREHVPEGGDVYLLSRVLANWPDPVAARILANCRAALGGTGTLLVFEMMAPDRVEAGMSVVEGDMNALAHLGGAVRTHTQFRDLLAGAGLRLDRVHRVPGTFWTLLESTSDGQP
ncbi:acetylserotonin O-methyltransferase [Goodfellowiella coeruleoviolacea]|uniref:Dimerization domain-containing protein n=1 Tax=Goodfellowiella coeruleoviolacea TaxID=334858 RepID=A0AAE3KJ19_9PSEU|nr:acetylserotonin O-methyltransferase [Goodfellowiella coeruleoviolacea]MCP2168577.1 dimerization domain-containing protein [Goodfellowiella coeruleoviolacea]